MRSESPFSALEKIAALLDGSDLRYVVGGSTGLALRGARLGRAPRDVDLYADEAEVRAVHALLQAYSIDEPRYDESGRYRSILSHYRIDGAVVELVGDFRIAAGASDYATEVAAVLFPACDRIVLGDVAVPVVPPGHELVFNLLRERADRAELAGALIAADPGKHLPTLLEITRRNRLAPELVAEAFRLANASVPGKEPKP